jgi:hypothetical protein
MRQLLPESGRTLDERVDLEAAYATPPDASLRANFVISLDAAVSVGGQSAALGGPADMEVFATLRALTDVVLVGASTVRAESYGPAKIAPPAIERRQARGQSPIPPIAVVTRTGDLDTDSHFFSREAVRGIVPPPSWSTMPSLWPRCGIGVWPRCCAKAGPPCWPDWFTPAWWTSCA